VDLDFENSSEKQTSKNPDLGSPASRGTGVLGFEYKAQVQVIKQKHGDLEQIRHRLGLSKRKISQILMVDPSAWTRWTRAGEDAPPHIYRALEWYLLLQAKYPGMDSPFWLEAVAKPNQLKVEANALKETMSSLKSEFSRLSHRLKWTQMGFVVLLSLLALGHILTSCSTTQKHIPTAKREVALPDKEILEIAKKFAPIFIHEIGPNEKADIFTDVDFDSDWKGDNNWQNLEKFELEPSVYYEVMRTSTHYFIMYALYHPRDYSYLCLPVLCHENDMEGVLVVVDRKSNQWIYTESVAHNFIYSQENLKNQERPTLIVEWGGHGIYPPGESAPHRATKVFNPQIYDLEPIAKIWNLQFKEHSLFEGQFDYEGERYRVTQIPKSFMGRRWTNDAANPPWAWVDLLQGQRGEIFFDPAHYVAEKHKKLAISLDYERNPYLIQPIRQHAEASLVSAQ